MRRCTRRMYWNRRSHEGQTKVTRGGRGGGASQQRGGAGPMSVVDNAGAGYDGGRLAVVTRGTAPGVDRDVAAERQGAEPADGRLVVIKRRRRCRRRRSVSAVFLHTTHRHTDTTTSSSRQTTGRRSEGHPLPNLTLTTKLTDDYYANAETPTAARRQMFRHIRTHNGPSGWKSTSFLRHEPHGITMNTDRVALKL